MGTHPDTHDYAIGNGDLLGITVFDVPELSREVRVSQSGTIGIPLVPVRLAVAGLTEIQAEQKIAEVLEANGLVSHAEVSVMVREHKSQPITVVGAVGHPMVIEADRTVTLLDVLAQAGGIANDAGDTVLISRMPPSSTEVSDSKVIEKQNAPGSGDPPPVEDPKPAEPLVQEKTETFPAANASIPSVKEPIPHPSSTFTINLNELVETGDMRNNITLRGEMWLPFRTPALFMF